MKKICREFSRRYFEQKNGIEEEVDEETLSVPHRVRYISGESYGLHSISDDIGSKFQFDQG